METDRAGRAAVNSLRRIESGSALDVPMESMGLAVAAVAAEELEEVLGQDV